MRSSQVVRETDCQCQSRNGPGQCCGSGYGSGQIRHHVAGSRACRSGSVYISKLYIFSRKFNVLTKILKIMTPIHCYKTLRRIPPPGPDGAGPNGQGKGKWMHYMVREISTSGPEVFRNQPKFSEITGYFRRFFLWKMVDICLVGSNSLPLDYRTSPLPLHHSCLVCKQRKYKIKNKIRRNRIKDNKDEQ